MRILKTEIQDVVIIEPRVFSDSRGMFFESFNNWEYKKHGLPTEFVQDNISRSQKNVIRGLHYQMENTQGKLVSVIQGDVFDVAVDLRKSSQYYGKHVSVVLSADKPRLFWVPPGFAHGFMVLSEAATFLYKVTDYYNSGAERTIKWDDATLNINWPLQDDFQPILSPKDLQGMTFLDAETYSF